MTIIADRYTLDRQIGAGGMGTVYLCTDIQTEDRVALKRLHRNRIEIQPELAERFVREADALRTLNHPNIVKAFEHFEFDGDHYIVMEYVEGQDLSDLIVNRGKLPLNRTVDIALGVADALTRAHYLRIIHRDLKPANVLLDAEGKPRLTDFGVAIWETKARMTAVGLQVGTPAYMAPEVVNGESADPRADIWALGVMLYEMLSGRHPFFDGSINHLMVNILTRPAPDIQSVRPDVPESLADLIDRMLAKDAAGRIGSARLVGAELEFISQIAAERESRQTVVGGTRFAHDEEPAAAVKHNVPTQATPLVGREDDVRQITRLLESGDTRLITLVGPGGMGKTRLALGVAHGILTGTTTTGTRAFEHGVMLVELAPLLSPEPLIATVANAVGFQFAAEGDPKQQLLDHLREKHLLLILDNFEHILDAAPLVAEILLAAPDVKVLATSRERLNLTAETIYPLAGLDIPSSAADPDTLKESGAVKLFVQSARRAVPGWTAAPEDYPFIADICRRVDGLPLGIVLAAGWVQMLNTGEIVTELARNFDILESDVRDMPSRHRSMRAVFDYSWQTMSAEERALVARLSVFRGGFSRRAGQDVADAGLRPLAALVNKSLLRRDPDRGSYHMHELLRQYAEAKLGEESREAHARHSAYYLATLAEIQPRLEGGAQIESLQAIDSDMENVRAAWMFAASQGDLSALERALPTMSLYFQLRGQYAEGLAFYEQTITALQSRTADSHRDSVLGHVAARAAELAVTLHQAEAAAALLSLSRNLIGESTGTARAALEFAQGFEHLTLRSVADGRPHFEQAAQIYRGVGERWALARVLGEWSSTYWYRADGASSDYERAKALAAEGLAIQRALGDTFGMANTLLHLGTIASYAGDDEDDARCTAESLALFQKVGHRYGMSHALNNIGVREMMRGDYESSRQHLEKSLAIKRDIGTLVPIVWSLFVLARLSYNEAQFAESLSRADSGLAMVAGTPHREWELTLQLSRGQAQTALGQYSAAVAAFDRALALAAELSIPEDEAFALNRKGAALLLSGDTDAGAACLTDAIAKSDAMDDVTTASVSRMLLARAALNRGDVNGAAAHQAPVAWYFADKTNWVVNYTSDEWLLSAWAIESALLSTEIAHAQGDSSASLLLSGALDDAHRAFSPAHARKAVAVAADLLSKTQPRIAARLAAAIVDDPRAYAVDRERARRVAARLPSPSDPFPLFDLALMAARQALK
jgi:predicted ATPase